MQQVAAHIPQLPIHYSCMCGRRWGAAAPARAAGGRHWRRVGGKFGWTDQRCDPAAAVAGAVEGGGSLEERIRGMIQQQPRQQQP